MSHPPANQTPPETPDQCSTWDDQDLAMQRLMKALLATSDEASRAGDASPGRHLARFAEGDSLPTPTQFGRELAVGEMFGRFLIEAEVGRGGFGVVYRAVDARLGRAVAVKVPRPDRVQSVALWDRFAREARLAGSLEHTAIVPVLDAGFVDGVLCVISAFQEGETLGRWLATRHPAGAPAGLSARLAAAIAEGLGHAHAHGVLHRDLKPANVLMVPTDAGAGAWSPRIVDFGLGTSEHDPDSQSMSGLWQGSPPYMAPEQVLPNLGRVDARSDIYALGAVLYEMLCGRAVYASASILELSLALGKNEPPARPRQLRNDLPRDLETIVLACLERDPGRRYPTADALVEDLNRFLDGRPVLARPLSAPRRLGRWIKRRPSQAALVALAVAASGLTAGLIARHEAQLSNKNLELSRGQVRLGDTIDRLDGANAALKSTLDRLRAVERTNRRTAYSANLHLAERELAAGRVELVQSLLRSYEPGPSESASDVDDIRCLSWHYLMRQAMRSYTIRPLLDLAWWRGPRPLAPTLEALDPETRNLVLKSLGASVFDHDGIRLADGNLTYVLDGGFMGFHCRNPDGPTPEALFHLDGRGGSPLGPPASWHGLAPDGRTLALIESNRLAGLREAPALVRYAPLGLPDPHDRHGGQGEKSAHSTRPPLQVIELARCSRLRFSSDGRILACLSWDSDGYPQKVIPLIYETGSEWRASYAEHSRPLHIDLPNSGPDGRRDIVEVNLALSADGRLAALVGDDPRLLVFETRTGKPVWSLDAKAFGETVLPTTLIFSPDGDVLAVGDSGGDVRVWDARTGAFLGESPVNVGYVTNVNFHPDSNTVAVIARGEDVIRFWDYAPGPDPPAVLDHGDEVWGLAFAEGGKVLVSVGDNNQARSWDVATGALVNTIESTNLLSAAVGGERWVMLAGFDGKVSSHTGRLSHEGYSLSRMKKGTRLRALALSPDHKTLVAGGNAPQLLVVDLSRASRPARLIDAPHQDAYGIAFSPDGRTMAVGSHDRVITLWDVPEHRHRATLNARGRVSCVAYAPDGGTLVSGDAEGGLQFWDMRTETLRTTVKRASETGGVWALSFSPDGRCLATGGDDGVVRLWDPELAIERISLAGHKAKVHAVTFSPDGRILASGDFDGGVRLWRGGP